MMDSEVRMTVFSAVCLVAVLVLAWLTDRVQAKKRARTLNNRTKASDPGGIAVSTRALQRLQPELFDAARWQLHLKRFPITCTCTEHHRADWWRTSVSEHLRHGDSQPAVVVSVEPLLIAAYSDELDAVALVHYDDAFANELRLRPGTRLLTVNTYLKHEAGEIAPDLSPGPRFLGRWHNFRPAIAELYAEDPAVPARKRATIPEETWLRVTELGREALSRFDGRARGGRQLVSDRPYGWNARAN